MKTNYEIYGEMKEAVASMKADGKSNADIKREMVNFIYDELDEREVKKESWLEAYTLEEILEELVDEMEKEYLTPFEIGKKLLKHKLNNEANMRWMREQLQGLGVAVRLAAK